MENKELKTLKDFAVNKLKKGTGGYAGKGIRADYAEIDLLRQEASKWILRKRPKMTCADWIDFFNITEEDLK